MSSRGDVHARPLRKRGLGKPTYCCGARERAASTRCPDLSLGLLPPAGGPLRRPAFRPWRSCSSAGRNRVVADELPEVVHVLDAVFGRLENLGMITGQGEGGLMRG